MAAPLFGYFAHHWADFWERTRDTSMFTPAARHHLGYGYGTENLGVILAIQLRAALSLFNLTGDNSVQYGYGGALLDPLSGALFVLGAGVAVAGLRQRRLRLILLWTLLPLIGGAALTVDTLLPAHQRLGPVRRAAGGAGALASARRARRRPAAPRRALGDRRRGRLRDRADPRRQLAHVLRRLRAAVSAFAGGRDRRLHQLATAAAAPRT